jgi:acetyl esterase/lipase
VATPPYLQPFVLAVAEAQRRREGSIDIYWPADAGTQPVPLVVFVHGGPIPADLRPTPRDWPAYLGYGALAASQGVAGITVDHRLHSLQAYPESADKVAAAVARARTLPGADPDRVALWFFSGGGLLAADWLAQPPPWLRCVALTYPLLAPLAGRDVDPRFRPADALRSAGELPVLLTRVGRERPEVAETVAAFTGEAERHHARLTVIDVPNGQHGFDTLDHSEESRAAVHQAMAWVVTALQR